MNVIRLKYMFGNRRLTVRNYFNSAERLRYGTKSVNGADFGSTYGINSVNSTEQYGIYTHIKKFENNNIYIHITNIYE